MAKDSYWFRHDTTAGRTLKMRKLQHIYGHEAKGIYWDVVEILREQAKYQFDSDDSSLQMLSDIIGYKDRVRFINWFNDCIRLNLLEKKEGVFFCPALCKSMKTWEAKKRAGSQGGRGNTKAKRKHNESITKAYGKEVTVQNRTVHNIREYLTQSERAMASIKYLREEKISLTPNEHISLIDRFITKLCADEDLMRPPQDYQRHFNNWAKINGTKTGLDSIGLYNALR